MPNRGYAGNALCMPRLVDTNLLGVTTDINGIERLIEALQSSGSPTVTLEPTAPCRAPTSGVEGDVDIFVQQFRDVAKENSRMG